MTAKFVKFQRPADFDGKLAHVKQLLEDIEERLNCLEIASSEPDDIQNQLDQCMVIGQKLSLCLCMYVCLCVCVLTRLAKIISATRKLVHLRAQT